mgnify:CR=1 FL=1
MRYGSPTFGFNAQADVRAVNLRYEAGTSRFDVALQAERGDDGVVPLIEGCTLPMPGDHNVSNALSAVAVARHLGMKKDEIRAALAKFGGVGRRFTKVAEIDGVTIIDDYGHHPVEIAAVLKAARQATKGRVIAVHQPHRYSRTRDLFEDFVRLPNPRHDGRIHARAAQVHGLPQGGHAKAIRTGTRHHRHNLGRAVAIGIGLDHRGHGAIHMPLTERLQVADDGAEVDLQKPGALAGVSSPLRRE